MLTINEKETGVKFGNVALHTPFVYEAYLYLKTKSCTFDVDGEAVRLHAKSGKITHVRDKFRAGTYIRPVVIEDVVVTITNGKS